MENKQRQNNLIETQNTTIGVSGFFVSNTNSNNPGTAYPATRPEQVIPFQFSTPEKIHLYDLGNGIVMGVSK